MILSFLNIIRLLFFSFTFWGVFLLGSELFFLVTNSSVNSSHRNEPPQDLSSGLFNSWVNENTNDYQKMKAKGAILIDLDWDNDLDLYYGFNNSYLFKNVNGFFINITDSSDIDQDALIGVVAGDVDNNGYPDIIKQRALPSSNHHLIMNQGNNVYNTVEYLPPMLLPDIHGQGLLDADLDGDLDIFIIQDEGTEQAFLFKNQGINPFGEVEFIQSFVFEVDDLSTSRTITIADYDNDGDQDIYVIRKFSINWLLENQTLTGEPGNVVYNSNPNPLFLEVSQSLNLDDQNVSTSGSMGYGAAWGDYDNDEDYDLYLANWGVNRLYKNDNGNFENVIEETSTNADTLNNGLAWPDLDNDGDVELWISSIRNHDNVFTNNLEEQLWDSSSSPKFLSATQDIIAGDYDNDGWIDIFTAGLEMNENDDNENDTTSAKYTSLLYKNIYSDSTMSNNNWVKFRLEGGKYDIDNDGWSNLANKSAIGARIILHSNIGNQMREIIASKGHGSMNPLVQHFGLKDEVTFEGFTIKWPSKDSTSNQQKITYYDGPFQANKIYTIVEHLGIVGIKGDTNDDQFVDVLDVVRTINEILNDNFLTDKELWAIDMNYDLSANILDIVRLVEFLLSP